ncbi:hypothetical protein NEAUS06_1940 [Nematocida ausubeli]|nr:hypothetical protein NEAUS06_1940 [Nematocida ausubeli]
MICYVETNRYTKTHKIIIVCLMCIWALSSIIATNNECASGRLTTENNEQMGTFQLASTSDTHYQKDSLELSTSNQTSIIVTKFYVDGFGNLFYIDDKGCRVFMCLTKDIVVEGDLLYNIYNDAFGNQILIDINMHPSAFNVEDISSRAHSTQEESILNPAEVTILKRPRDSTSTRLGDNLSSKKRKYTKNIKDTDSISRIIIYNNKDKYKNAFNNLEAYKSKAQSDTTRDNPHGFSYLFTKGSMNNENIKCECSIKKNYEYELQFWQFLTQSYHNSLAEKINCIKNLMNEMEKKRNSIKIINYYHFFLEDLNRYIESHINIEHIRAKYNYTDSCKNNICSMSKTEPETLGEIYEETQTDLKWWANSMSIISKKTEEMKKECLIDDAALKENLHLILKLPEILRDLVLITPEILFKIKEEMKNISDSEASEALCIIEYLYYLVNDDLDKMNIAYNEVKALFIDRESIDIHCTVMVYRWAYYAFCCFYKYAPFTCVADVKSEEDNPKNKEAAVKNIFQSHCPHIPQNGVFRLHGKRAIVPPTLRKYNQYEATKMAGHNSMVIEQQNQQFLNLSHHRFNDHYHVQLVDNSRHTVKLIPIPYIYIERPDSSRISIQQKIYLIRDIVDYIKFILKSTYPEKISDFNVYPFKYRRKEKTWTVLTGFTKREYTLNLTIDKTLVEIVNANCDVVFYYFEEDIATDYFECVDFQISVDPNSETPRIPLFLTNSMLVSAIVSPYIWKTPANTATRVIAKSDHPTTKAINFIQMTIDTAATSQSSSSASPSNNESQPKRSYIKYYYSDFLVRDINDYRFCTAECFGAGILSELSENPHRPSTVWYTQVKRSIREYTNYCFSISSIQKLQSDSLLQCEEKVALTFLDILQRESSSGDKVTYGLCIYQRSLDGKEVAIPIMCEKMRRLLSANIDGEIKSKHANWESDILPPRIYIKHIKEDTPVFITVKAFNYTQANLGMHYDMLAALFHNKNKSAPAP